MNTIQYCIEKRSFPLKTSEIFSVIGFGFGIFGGLSSFDQIPGWGLWVFPLLSVFIGLIIWSEIKIWNDWERQFTIGANYGGEDSYRAINNAKKSISVTHFSRDIPSERYQLLLKEKLNQKVRIIRYTSRNINLEEKNFEWLKSFKDIKHYYQIKLDVEDFPMDILIIDDLYVKLRFPVNSYQPEFLETLSFNNSKVASLFNKLLNRIEKA